MNFEWGGQRNGQQEYVPRILSPSRPGTLWHDPTNFGDTVETVSMASLDHH